MPAIDLDPELKRIARFLPRGLAGPLSIRVFRAVQHLATRPAKDVAVERVGAISLRLHRPPGLPGRLPAMLWIHGGGYVIGNAAQDDPICRKLARDVGMLVAAVDYRLAPEHPFPTPLEDCYAGLTWLAAHADVDPTRIAIGGASAGGGLAAALALLSRDRDEVKPVLQVLAYPMLDDRTALRADVDEGAFRLWNNRSNRFGWQSYTGHEPGSDRISGLAAPARHEDLTGLPPAWLGVGTQDLFHDEDLAYAERLSAAGVPVEVHVSPGAFHGFDVVAAKAAVSRAFRDSQVAALTQALAGVGE